MSPEATPSRSSIRKARTQFGGGRALSNTRTLVQRNLWIGPILAILALIFAATWLRGKIEQGIEQQKEGELTALLQSNVAALRLWIQSQQDIAGSIVEDPQVHDAVLALVKRVDAGETSGGQLLQAPAQKELDAALAPWLDGEGYFGYAVFTPKSLIISAKPDVLVGQVAPLGQEEFIQQVLTGKPHVSRPVGSMVIMPDETGQMATGVPVMFAAAPIFAAPESKEVVAVVALRIRPTEFSKILSVARPGATGETYAFDSKGILLSNSRFDDELKELALIPDQPNSRSALALELRDPGVDLTSGARSATPRKQQPLTQMAEQAIREQPPVDKPGVNVRGYRDYRGAWTIGAWAWLPQYGFGVVTEMDKAEAFAPVAILRNVFWGLMSMLALSALALLGLTILARRMERRMRDAVLAAGQLGQYKLEQKIGEGGMGSVYRARHALLRRPTAVKLLEPSKTTDVSVARFEREVQLTSQLNHPNTITIFDFGRTNEGIFYYAMELLDGFPLDSLVERFGPVPDGRVIQILSQVCGSLMEAHSQGLIHRDIKPANIMLTRRGGVCDFVKLLDFGLVKAIDSKKTRALTAADAITGTPLYMPPESIAGTDECDARSDLYSLGAVGYYLLTGKAVFDTGGVMEVMRSHVEARPIPPTKRLAKPMSRDLEQLILKCLEKSPDARPQSAGEMAEALSHCVPEQPWSPLDAVRWWKQNQDAGITSGPSTAATQDVPLGATLGYSEVKQPQNPPVG